MIKVCYPPGCYGHYLTRSIYNYTNLRVENYKNFEFDNSGSSHVYRKNKKSRLKIRYGHLDLADKITFDDNDDIVTILPCVDHRIDYYNNQFDKHAKKALIKYITSQLPSIEIAQKLNQGWGYSNKFSSNTPTWILREFFSLWIVDCIKDGYSVEKYKNVNSKIQITTQDIFLNFPTVLSNICKELNLLINIDNDSITKNHKKFLNLQKYHNSQLKCQQWVNDTINNEYSLNPCQTIFDESFVQHLLRESGFELKCDGLNIFPANSIDMKKLTYKI
jgi:hypothetical protein